MRRLMRGFGVATIAVIALVHSSSAQEAPHPALLDARSAIRQITTNDPETKIERAERAFVDHIRAFCGHSTDESPYEAAVAWLALLDEAIAVPRRSLNGSLGGSPPQPIGTLYSVLIALPRPEVWPEIETLVAKRAPSSDRTTLLMLCARLRGDDEGVIRLCEEYDREAFVGRAHNMWPPGTNAVRLAALRRLGRFSDPKVIEQALSTPGEHSNPNLMDIVPATVAKETILYVLKQMDGPVQFGNPENVKLAKQVALDHFDELPKAPWSLAGGWDDLPYVKRLIQHYGYASLVNPNSQASSAQQIYFRDLALHGKLEEAARLANDCQSPPSLSPEDWGPAANIDQFIADLQARAPHADLWDLYVSAAIASGHTGVAIKRLRAEIANPSTPHERRLTLLWLVFDLHTRMGDVAALVQDWETAPRSRRSPSEWDPTDKLLSIALAVKDDKLAEKIITHELAADNPAVSGAVERALLDRDRLSELERLVYRQLEKNRSDSYGATADARTLCQIYYWAERPRDILSLLKNFPSWSENDLYKLVERGRNDYLRDEDQADPPVAFYAAWAFSKTGQIDLAMRTLRVLMLRQYDMPPVSDLLNEIGGSSSLGVYNDVIKVHPFAPWPILGKGYLMLGRGKLAEAEACAREAAAIAPGGSFFYRRRLNELSRLIFVKQGNKEAVRQFNYRRGALIAAERGSELEREGLSPQAHQALQIALHAWPDDSALHAQFAHCLVLECLPEEATVHYRKAFEFLSSGLGENFDGTSEMESMAYHSNLALLGREVLNRIISKNPKDTGAYYARGMLNFDAGHTNEALSDFKKVVIADPRHVGAWEMLALLGREGFMKPEEAQTIEHSLIDLHAESKYEGGWPSDLAGVSDLGWAYRALEARLHSLPAEGRRSLFPLHSTSKSDPRDAILEFGRGYTPGRPTGWYFQNSTDIMLIAHLYHPTSFPF